MKQRPPEEMSPCYDPPTPPALMVYSGFKATFTNHDWCTRHYIGTEVDGKIVRCGCPCHKRGKQGVLPLTVGAPR